MSGAKELLALSDDDKVLSSISVEPSRWPVAMIVDQMPVPELIEGETEAGYLSRAIGIFAEGGPGRWERTFAGWSYSSGLCPGTITVFMMSEDPTDWFALSVSHPEPIMGLLEGDYDSEMFPQRLVHVHKSTGFSITPELLATCGAPFSLDELASYCIPQASLFRYMAGDMDERDFAESSAAYYEAISLRSIQFAGDDGSEVLQVGAIDVRPR
jgi:hypothetical protein